MFYNGPSTSETGPYGVNPIYEVCIKPTSSISNQEIE